MIVRVARDIFPPTINLPATRTIEEDVDITSFVFEVNLDDLDKKVRARK